MYMQASAKLIQIYHPIVLKLGTYMYMYMYMYMYVTQSFAGIRFARAVQAIGWLPLRFTIGSRR